MTNHHSSDSIVVLRELSPFEPAKYVCGRGRSRSLVQSTLLALLPLRRKFTFSNRTYLLHCRAHAISLPVQHCGYKTIINLRFCKHTLPSNAVSNLRWQRKEQPRLVSCLHPCISFPDSSVDGKVLDLIRQKYVGGKSLSGGPETK